MRIYLLNPPYFPHFGREMRWQDTGRGGTLYYPIWLSYATGLLEQKGHSVRLVDAPAWNWSEQEVIEDLQGFKPDMLIVGTSFTSLNNDLSLSKRLKESTNALTVMVGPPCSQYPERMLDYVDIIVRNEYEGALVHLAECISAHDLDKVLGISYKKEGNIASNPDNAWSTSDDLDKMPFVTQTYKKYLNIGDYFLNYSLYPMVQIFSGRGCPYHCTFCSWPQNFMGRKYRARSVENILDEVQWVQENLPEVREIFFEDDTFTINRKRVHEFCREYTHRGLNIAWSCNARVDTLDLDTMCAMKNANCRFLIVGFETANDSILKNIKKGFTVNQAREFVKCIKDSNLLLHADFVIGLPGETRETIEETKRFIREINPDLLQVSVSSPFPGTELYNWYKQNNYLLTEDPNDYLDECGHQKCIIFCPTLTAGDIVREVDNILKEYYISMRFVQNLLKQIIRKKGLSEAKRIWRSGRGFIHYITTRHSN